MNAPVHLEAVSRRLYGSVNRIAWQPAHIVTILAKFGASGIDVRDLGNGGYRPWAMPTIRDVAAVTNDGDGSITTTLSRPDIDRAGDSIAISAWNFQTFIKTNPVVLFQHDASLVPIGRATRVWVDGQRLRATFQLAPADVNPLAARVRKLIDGQFLNAVSVGFLPLKFKFSDDPARPFGIDFLSVELLEFSVVSIPALPSALIDAPGQTGKNLSRAQARRQRDLDVVWARAR